MLELNPMSSVKPPAKERARDRVVTREEVVACWNAAQVEGFPFEQAVKLLILTGQRRGEVANMRWSELDFENTIWTIPASRTKNARQQLVPLAPLAIDILRSIPRFVASDLVFTTTGQTPISGFSRLKRRLDFETGALNWRFHDIRRTVATNMAMEGIQPHVIEAVLNHKTGIVSGVAAVYNCYGYLDEKRDALTRWAARFEGLGTEKHSAKFETMSGNGNTSERDFSIRSVKIR